MIRERFSPDHFVPGQDSELDCVTWEKGDKWRAEKGRCFRFLPCPKPEFHNLMDAELKRREKTGSVLKVWYQLLALTSLPFSVGHLINSHVPSY